MKTCKKCGLDKPFDSFTVDVRYKDGRYPWCAECRAAYRHEKRHGATRAETLTYYRDYREQNIDEARQYEREYYHEHKDKWRRQESKMWHGDAAYRERRRQKDKRTYQTNPASRRRKIDNAIVWTHVRRARIRGLSAHYTQAEWRALCAKYDHRCLCCGRQEPEILLTPDHVRPLSRGGSNSIDNLQPLCLDCNLRKNAREIDYRPDRDG